MALPSSGVLSFYDIQTEMGGSNPISLTEYYGVSGLPSSGTIKVSDFHGKSKPSGSWERTTVGTTSWTVPAGVYSVQLCMIGGGGAGGTNWNNPSGGPKGGGSAGQRINQVVSVSPGENVTVVVGAGGTQSGNYGTNGSPSSFKNVSASGGLTNAIFSNPTTVSCGGTFSSGGNYGEYWGGEGGFAKGGNARGGSGPASGTRGAGGGAGVINSNLGYGGVGVVKFTWG